MRNGNRKTAMRRTLWSLLALVMVAAACGGGDSADDDGDTGGTTPGSSGTGEVEAGGELVYGAPFTLSTTFDPHRASLGQDNEWLFPAYDRLIHQTPDGEPEPGLASDWEYSDDGTTLTLTLRDGVTFHDGEVLDAEAVKANIERGKELSDSGVVADLATIEEVQVVDDQTVDLLLTRPDAGLVLKLSDRAGVMISPAAFAGDDSALAESEAGAGMYELVEYVPGDRAVYEPYADYWDPDAVKLSRLEIIAMIDPATRFNALRSGEVDAAYVAPADADAAESDGLTVTPVPSLEVYYLGLNRSRAEFGDEQVRQAMLRAIDRQGLVDALLFGMGTPTTQMFPPGYWANDPDIADEWSYDVEAAQQLMDEAGVDGFSFEVVVPGPEAVPTMEGVASQLGEIGIDVSIRQMEPAEAAQVYTFDKAADAIIGPWSGRPDPSQTVELLYLPDGSLNVNGGSTPEIEALAAEGERTFDQAEREGVYQELSAAMTESALYLPIYSRQRPLVSDSQVSGLVPYLSGKLEFRGVGVAG